MYIISKALVDSSKYKAQLTMCAQWMINHVFLLFKLYSNLSVLLISEQSELIQMCSPKYPKWWKLSINTKP